MTKEELLSILDYAIENGKGIHVSIYMPNLPEKELIVNPKENVPEKRNYYEQAYDDDCRLKAAPQIKIINAITY